MVKFSRRFNQCGFTVIELITVIAILGILAAIGAPFGFSFLEDYRTTSARDDVHLALRQAQDKAAQEKTPWRFAIRQQADYVEWAVYPDASSALSAKWQRVGTASLRIDAETTLERTGDLYYVRFDERGTLDLWLLGRITLLSKHFPKMKRCVIVSTILGAMRTSEEKSVPDPEYRRGDRFCY